MEEKVFQYIKEHPGCTSQNIASMLRHKDSLTSIKFFNIMKKLKRKDRSIYCTKETGYHHWYIKTNRNLLDKLIIFWYNNIRK